MSQRSATVVSLPQALCLLPGSIEKEVLIKALQKFGDRSPLCHEKAAHSEAWRIRKR